MTDLDDLVTGADIGRRLGLSTQRVHQLAATKGFPKPLGRVGNYVVWRWDAVEKWSQRRDTDAWIASVIARVPKGDIVQSLFRSHLQNALQAVIAGNPDTAGWTVADALEFAAEDLASEPQFDAELLLLEWPSARADASV